MATAQSIRDEFFALSEALLELRTLADLASDLAGDDPKATQWPWLLGQMLDRAEKAHEAVENSVRRAALPLLEDMSALTKR